MDEKAKKKRSEIYRSNLGSSFELEPNEGKKKKHKERKKKHATDQIPHSNKTLEENCTGEAADKQTCSIEGNITFMRNGKEVSHINKRKKKKVRKDIEVMDNNIADDKEVQFLDENQQSKMKKRKNYDDPLTGMQEMGSSKPSKKGKMTEDNELKNNEGDLPLDRIDTGNANAHSLVAEVDFQGKGMEKKKLSKINKRTEDEEYETNGGDPCLAKSNVVDLPSVQSNGDQHLVKSNEGENDDQGKKKKKLSEESKHKEYNEFKSNEGEDDDPSKKTKKKKKLIGESKHKKYNEFGSDDGEDGDQGKKKKKKLSEERKHKEYNEFKSNEGEDDDPSKKMKKKKKLIEESKHKKYNEFGSDEGEDGDQGKKKKKKKLSEERKHKEYNEFKSNEGEDDDPGKKMKKKKKLIEESKHKEYNEFGSDEGEDGDQGKKKKKLSDKRKSKENSEFNSNEGDPPLARVESRDANARCIVTEVNDQGKKMKKKTKAKAGTGESPSPARDGSSKPKRVTFSDQVEICGDSLVRGKRFTPEEDEKIKAAVFDYIESHGLGDEGLDMILHCKSHHKIRDCWKEIAAALPERPQTSVYSRAHIIFERDEKHKWTPDELEFIQKVQKQHGSDWKSIAEVLGKHRFHVKDAWRRIKLTDTNRGRWSQEEYQKLFDLVNLDLRLRAAEDYRKSKHGMLRDNISWEAIANEFTRTSQRCCKKWYEQLTSRMVADGEWCDTDDYRLLDALYTLDACCMEEVDWDNLLEQRSGDVCRKRWNQMVRYIGEHGGKSFAEQVEILAKRFCPDLLEAREAFDSKPVIC